MSHKRTGRAPALFDDTAFAEDLKRAGNAGQKVALAARHSFEETGVPLEELHACDEEGPNGTALLALPPPDDFARADSYEIALRRLNG